MADSGRLISLNLPVAPVRPCPEDATWVCCLNCDAPLDLHQPRAEEPQRFVGTCDRCGRWYLLDWNPLSEEGSMLLLPAPEEVRAAARVDQE